MKKILLTITAILILLPLISFAEDAKPLLNLPVPSAPSLSKGAETMTVEKVVAPKLNVTIPTLPSFSAAKINKKSSGDSTSADIPWLAEYLLAIYKYALIIGSGLAVLMLMIGGFLYSASGLNQAWVKKGKQLALGSLTGLILLLAAYSVLYLINPKLTTLSSFNLAAVGTTGIDMDDQSTTSWLAQGHGPCWTQIIKQTETEMDASLQKSCPFLGNSNTGGCSALIQPLFEAISKEIMADPRWPDFQKIVYSFGGAPGCPGKESVKQRPWIYNWRCVASCPKSECPKETCISNKTGKWRPSPHSFGVAVDIDVCHNPACSKKADGTYDTECEKYNSGNPIPTTMPTWVINIFKKYNFIWGGNWKNYYDPMHFEWSGACAGGIVPTADPSTIGCCILHDGTQIDSLSVPQCEGLDSMNLPMWAQGACK